MGLMLLTCSVCCRSGYTVLDDLHNPVWNCESAQQQQPQRMARQPLYPDPVAAGAA